MLRLFFATVFLASTLVSSTFIAISYHIEKTWNGGPIDHDPIKITFQGDDQENLLFSIEAPFFNDPPNPGGKPSEPFFGLWNNEVVEAFFLNDDNQYLEVEVAPWGQHIVLMFKAQRKTIRHSLPMRVETTIKGDKWNGTAKIPLSYLPPKVTKFNAYAIHGSEPNRIYEALYTAPETALNPDFHALQYFSNIDLSQLIPPGTNDESSELWQDALNGLFRYRITTKWNGETLNHPSIMVTLQGFQDGIEMNVTGPLFNDPAAPSAKPGPLEDLDEYEVVEMLFMNERNELLHVNLGPWGHYQVILDDDFSHARLKDSLPLDYIVSQDQEKNTWKGSALIPQSFFPPSINLMNAFASHGSGSKRIYEMLYSAPSGSSLDDRYNPDYFKAIDFEFLEPENPNSGYSNVWEEAKSREDITTVDTRQFDSEAVTTTPEEVVTMLGPNLSENPKPNRKHSLRRLDESLGNKQQQIETSVPGRDQGLVNVKQQQQGKGHPLQKKQDPLHEEDPPQVPVLTKEDLPQAPVLTKEDLPQIPVPTKEEPLEEPFKEPLQDPLHETEVPFLDKDPLQDLFPNTELDQTRPVKPPPHPLCFEEGLVQDFIRCQVFHECVVENNEWHVYHWRCPRGQYFDQEKIACLPGLVC